MRFFFLLGEAFSGIKQNLSIVISVVLVTFISLGFVGAAGLLQLQINHLKGYWYDRVEVAIFLCTDTSPSPNCAAGKASPADTKAIEQKLASDEAAPYVKSYEYESQEQALKLFKEQFASSDIANSVTADQLPASFRVALKNPEQYESINELFGSMNGVEVVADQRELLEQVFSLMNMASLVAVSIAVIMLVAATLLIATTIRLSAFTRHREVVIMRLVGASKAMIQTPFILEGLIAALLGALLASISTWAIAHYGLSGWLADQYPTTGFIGGAEAFQVIPVLFLIAILLTAVSSMLTLRKYLNV